MGRRKKKKSNDKIVLIIGSLIILLAIILITAYLSKYDRERAEKNSLKRVYTPYTFPSEKDKKEVKQTKKREKKDKKKFAKEVKVLVEDFLFLSNVSFSEETLKNYTQFNILLKESEYPLILEKMKVFSGRKEIILKLKKVSENKIIWYLFKNKYLVAEIVVKIQKVEKKIGVKYPKVSIIIDDIGNSKEVLKKLSSIKYKFAISILPNSTYRDYASEIGKRFNKQIMLHLPMEPVKKNGYRMDLTGFLLVNMRDEVIRNFTEEYLDLVPDAVGVNNHTGSLFTQYRNKMKVVLKVLKERNKFFVDSKTTAKTVAYELAKKMGIRAGIRDVFLDNENEKITILNFKHLFSIAQHKGEAIGICHPNKTTVDVLRNKVSSILKEYKVRLVFPSEIVK